MIDCLKCMDCGWSVTPGQTHEPEIESHVASTRRLVAIDTAARLAARILKPTERSAPEPFYTDGPGEAIFSAMTQQLQKTNE